ncbi:helix-turn-helix domain-containing protein [Streptomyces sp. A73]|uniref:helix-turn-helix domain-containing protein n=1 Tax=unclassified Streptomyces TaxID=2593676 RepID=UPI001B387B58|nr:MULTISPECIES: helix-turn-helix domain-containing protein [unclassified Streptomyces]MBQ0868476.1 helix-turn-helix domain-containing protein [Streptomyces sp. RK75]MBQ1119209.1 helix-turn-helix domain-containing protein [Streptomyces sp. B15]MBQ1160712.1 helix-turn-helix domain-containing protein [Streptomyces sp. A73]
MAVTTGLLNVDQVATRLQVSRWTVYNLIRSRELASFTIGRCRRIAESALHDYIARQTEREAA